VSSFERGFSFPAHKVSMTVYEHDVCFTFTILGISVGSIAFCTLRMSSIPQYHLDALLKFPEDVQGPVKCIAGTFPFVASGGADDTVHIYNTQVCFSVLLQRAWRLKL
jgi:hypothetical protein